ncbi:MAG TPA: OmpA family protein, partial [Tepidisphaeraceae bacterium]
MRDVTKWLSLAALGVSVSLTGCVSQGQYKKAVAERDQLKGEVESARAEAEDYRNQLGAITDASNGKDEQITSLSSANADLQAQLEEINRQYAEALERANNPLPAELNQELSSFAASNSDMVEFDQEHGIVKFKSDVTFAPGAVELTPKAREVVARLSKVLNDQGVSAYELMIAGHTDSMPVERAATIRAGHLDNWYLSAHRAISVGKCLQKNHVSGSRMAMVGYADQRPVASNVTSDGRAKNRRVELLILPHKAETASA